MRINLYYVCVQIAIENIFARIMKQNCNRSETAKRGCIYIYITYIVALHRIMILLCEQYDYNNHGLGVKKIKNMQLTIIAH